mmetsp:Transcript_83849/g.237432  ORF Transcript_83849/g.237432 Transcript_83849/m.237432 type:complete len:250 (-) Transcript_83849:507-1256(-)
MLVTEVPVHCEVEKRMELVHLVLYGRPRQRDTGVPNAVANLFHGLGELRAVVLDALGLVDHHARESDAGTIAQGGYVVPHHVVGGEHDVHAAAGKLPLWAMVQIDLQLRSPLLEFLLPIAQQPGRYNHEPRTAHPSLVSEQAVVVEVHQHGDRLNCFPETHVVRKDRPEPVARQRREPLESRDLVRPQDAREAGRRPNLLLPVEAERYFVEVWRLWNQPDVLELGVAQARPQQLEKVQLHWRRLHSRAT